MNCFNLALESGGLHTKDPIIADGKLHRFNVQGDRSGSKNGWYVLFDGPVPAGAFGSWKTGQKHNWCGKAENTLTPFQRAEFRRRIDTARKAHEAEEEAQHKAAANRASELWKALPSAPDNHTYLVKKGVRNHGLRLHKGMLVIPMRDSTGHLHSLQFIDGEGNKRFLKGGRKKGCYFAIGNLIESICIAEGYATSASIYEATGLPVAVAFDAGNLETVARALRAAFPKIKITLCADNDEQTPGNPGLTNATKAAQAVGGYLAVPPCAGDFNDLLKVEKNHDGK